MYVEIVSKLAYFRTLRKEASSRIPRLWIYWSGNAVLNLLSTNQITLDQFPADLNYTGLNVFAFLHKDFALSEKESNHLRSQLFLLGLQPSQHST